MKIFILFTACVSIYWCSIAFESKEYEVIQKEIIEDDIDVYAGRFDEAQSYYNVFGLPKDREWLTSYEWRGEHLIDSSERRRRNFSNWKKEHIQNFISEWGFYATEECKATNVPASIIIAQAILESNWGLSRLAVEANNYFGHKCRNINDDFIIAADDSPNDKFTKYKSVWNNIRNHSNILSGMYKRRLKGNKLHHWLEALCGGMTIEDSKEFVEKGNKVYATSCYTGEECYSKKLKRIINCYKLYKYDINANK